MAANKIVSLRGDKCWRKMDRKEVFKQVKGMERLKVENFGPIKEVDVCFGDLTILVGPQASGKSLFLELFKLVQDKYSIVNKLRSYNYILPKNNVDFILDNYFGEGLHSLFRPETMIKHNDKQFNVSVELKSGKNKQESVFYIPAQRILSISDGRPKNFMEFDNSSPFVLRNFSETLRVFIQGGLGSPDVIFPMRNRLKKTIKNSIDDSIFHKSRVIIDQGSGQRKMKLNVGGINLPFMTWSAGQKEFMPLLLAMYCLSGPPTSVIDKSNYKWVIIEEPEMGLHPRAIQTVILEILELVEFGYKVVVSTHSPTMLEFVWVFETLKNLAEDKLKSALCELFEVGDGSSVASLFDGLKTKEMRSYFFSLDGNGVQSCDISSLDVGSSELFEAEWGGLSTFSSRAADVVSRHYQDNIQPK